MARSETLTEYIPDQIWLKNYPIRFAGCRFDARMCVIRLIDGRLLIHSPCPIDENTKKEIEALGSVAVIIGPGDYHYFNLQSAMQAFPDAELHLCPGIERKAPTLPCPKIIGDEPDPLWATELDHVLIRGSRLIQEVAFYHRQSATLILVDVIENFSEKTPNIGGLLKIWWWLFRMWNRAKPAPEYQISWKNKSAARKAFKRILDWDFERIIIAHGDLIEESAHEVAKSAWTKILDAGVEGSLSSYDSVRQLELLRDLDNTLTLMDSSLVEQFGEDTARHMDESG